MNRKFGDPTFENFARQEGGFENEKVRDLELFLKETSETLKKEGVPVNADCRIDENSFKKIYSSEEIKRDADKIKAYKTTWGDEKNRKEFDGEKLEMLKTAIFHKFMNKDFIVIRSSETDDTCHGIDNVILDRKTGEIVSAFDEVSEIKGERYEEKSGKIMGKNSRGAFLKYGLALDADKKIIFQKLNNIPLFYLALPKRYLENGIKKFQKEKFSDYEKKLFDYFVLSIKTQIKEMELKSTIPHEIQEKAKRFNDSIKTYLK
ncbi:MAG TPA: hypothetical protein VMW82_01625 [Candidatus Paceibacterota bacterium]|nr:hypothetical protein [Candidatus Paceibacterota bacterium]